MKQIVRVRRFNGSLRDQVDREVVLVCIIDHLYTEMALVSPRIYAHITNNRAGDEAVVSVNAGKRRPRAAGPRQISQAAVHQ
jgi:hypothetical protein